jgi:hypothetical protein
MVKVGLWGGHKIRCTADHRFAVECNVPRGVGIDWAPISEVQTTPKRFGGTVGPKNGVLSLTEFPDYENNRWKEKTVEAPFDDYTLGVVGAFIAEGTLNSSNEIQIWQSVHGVPIRSLVKCWARIHGLPCRESNDGVFVQARKRPDLIDLFQCCGSSSENKMIPRNVLGGSSRQLDIVLEWIIEGDGHRRSERSRTRDSYKEWDIYTSSEVLASQLRFVGLRVGKPMSISTRNRESYNHPQFALSYNPESFRMDEILPKLGKTAVGEIEPDGEDLAYDLDVDGTPWFVLAESGCLVHNSDVHRHFLMGTQNYWHSRCGCVDGVVLSEVWPDCLIVSPNPKNEEIYYRCPRCKMRIRDPQNGRYIPHNPGAEVASYHIHQMLSKYIGPSEIWRAYQTTTHIKEFFNAKLGKPYVDEENVPITMDDLLACEREDIQWGERYGKRKRIGMGVDQMGGDNYVIIAELTDDKKRILHYEIIDSSNTIYFEEGQRITPFKRLYTLMNEFDVDLCIVDSMPNINEALDFARAFPKRVFVAWYIDSHGGSHGRDMVQWGDRVKEKQTVRRGGPKIKFKYTCVLNRYMTIDFSTSEIGHRNCEWPKPGKLVQVCRSLDSGRFEPLHIMRTHFYLHMTKIVRQKTIVDEDTGRFRMEWVNLGLDPHSVHAWNYCNIALERLRKVPLMTFA